MADVQLEHGYLRLANELATAIALAPWDSASQPRMVTALVRATYGMNRKDAEIGTAGWRALTGLSERQVLTTKKRLQQAGVLVLVRDFDARAQRPQCWRLAKDYTEWGSFAVTEAAVEAAEGVVYGAKNPLRASAPPEPDGRGDPLNQSGGDQVQSSGGAPLNQSGGGAEVKSLGDNGPSDRKDSKDKKDTRKKALSVDGESQGAGDDDADEDEIRAEMRDLIEQAKPKAEKPTVFEADARNLIDSYSTWRDPDGSAIPWADRPPLFRMAIRRHLAEPKYRLRSSLRYVITTERDPYDLPSANGSGLSADDEAEHYREHREDGANRRGGELTRAGEALKAEEARQDELDQRIRSWADLNPDAAKRLEREAAEEVAGDEALAQLPDSVVRGIVLGRYRDRVVKRIEDEETAHA